MTNVAGASPPAASSDEDHQNLVEDLLDSPAEGETVADGTNEEVSRPEIVGKPDGEESNQLKSSSNEGEQGAASKTEEEEEVGQQSRQSKGVDDNLADLLKEYELA